jgi:hypothetical protein
VVLDWWRLQVRLRETPDARNAILAERRQRLEAEARERADRESVPSESERPHWSADPEWYRDPDYATKRRRGY